MKAIEIKVNSRTGGYYAEFEHNGEMYYASLCYTSDHGNECMIFPKGSWSEVYWKEDLAITRENLMKCIEDFIKIGVKPLASAMGI